MENCNTAGSAFRPYKNLDSFFNQSLNNFWSNDNLNDIPAHNVKTSEEHYIIELAAPGLKKEDFVINVEDNKLTIKADLKKSEDNGEQPTPTYLKREFSYKKFSRSFQLDKTISSDHIQAAYENGILSVTLAKVNKSDIVRKIEIV